MLKVTLSYILNHKLMSLVALYFLGSTILKSVSGIDICIPCIWKTLFGIHCPGCGLTTAFIHLLKLDVLKAFNSNWMVFIIFPLGLFYVGRDFYNYYKKELI
jgi:hypothetical protein